FLSKGVVEKVRREIPRLATFIPLSRAPNFAEGLKRERAREGWVALSGEDRAALAVLDRPDWWRDEATAEKVHEPLLRAAAWYYLHARGARGGPLGLVARFHLGNGARLARPNLLRDMSERGQEPTHRIVGKFPLRHQ